MQTTAAGEGHRSGQNESSAASSSAKRVTSRMLLDGSTAGQKSGGTHEARSSPRIEICPSLPATNTMLSVGEPGPVSAGR